MRKSTLREVSKFASGVVAGDFLCGLWLYFGNRLPIRFLGVYLDNKLTVAWMIFDALLFAFLFHYGWRMENRPRTESEKRFHLTVGFLFLAIALVHLYRILFGLSFVIGSWVVPYWVNGLGVFVTGFLAFISFNLAGKEK